MKKTIFILSMFFFVSGSGQNLTIQFLDEEESPISYLQAIINGNGLVSNENGIIPLLGELPFEVNIVTSRIGFYPLDTTLSLQSPFTTFHLKKNTFELQEIEVISSWVDEDEPFTATVLSGFELESKKGVQDIPIVISSMPNIISTSDAGNGVGYTQFRIRGTDPTRVNVTIDGIPLNEAESQLVYWVDLPDFIENTNAIQVQRGVGPSSNGEGVFGATVNLVSEKIVDKNYYALRTELGSFNTQKYSGKIGLKLNDKMSIISRASYIKSDGYIDRASSDLKSFYTSLNYVDNLSTAQIKAFYGHEKTYQAWNGVPIQYADDEELRTFNTAGLLQDGSFYENEIDNYRQTHIHLHYNRKIGLNTLSLKAHYTDGGGYYEQYKENQNGPNYNIAQDKVDLIRQLWLRTDYAGGIFSYHINKWDRSKLSVGLSTTAYFGDHFGDIRKFINPVGNVNFSNPYYENSANKYTYSAYVQNNWKANDLVNLYIDLQYRGLEYSYLGWDENGQNIQKSKTHHFFNPKLGILFRPSDKSSLYLSASVANKEPNRNDYVDAQSNQEPMPESLFDFEAGWKIHHNRLQLSSNLYWMKYRNQLVLTGRLNSVGEYIRTNVKNSQRVGIEVDAHYQFSDNFDLAMNTSLSSNTISNFTEYIDNWDNGEQSIQHYDKSTLAFSPNLVSFLKLNYHRNRWIFSLDGKYVSRQYLDNSQNESRILHHYFFSNATVIYRPQINQFNNVQCKLQINNITNSRYSANGWTYRFISKDYNPISDDPYSSIDNSLDGAYQLIGLYPQAGIHFNVGLSIGL